MAKSRLRKHGMPSSLSIRTAAKWRQSRRPTPTRRAHTRTAPRSFRCSSTPIGRTSASAKCSCRGLSAHTPRFGEQSEWAPIRTMRRRMRRSSSITERTACGVSRSSRADWIRQISFAMSRAFRSTSSEPLVIMRTCLTIRCMIGDHC